MKTYFADKPEFPLPSIEGTWQYIKYPVACQIKIDGEFEYYDGKLINKYGRVREDIAITRELSGFSVILAGELYYNEGKSFFDEMLSHKFDGALKFIVFDILKIGNNWINEEPYEMRRTILETVITPSDHVRLAEQYICKDKPAVEALFSKVTAQGYEGLVVKNLSSKFIDGTCQSMMKLKKTETLDVYATGYKKDKDAIAIGTKTGEIIGAVGNAGKEFYEALKKVKLQSIIKEDKEYCYVEAQYCIEIKHLGVLKSGMLRNATMIRQREDKGVRIR